MKQIPFIMETSFAPSPIANVTAFLFFLIISTTIAFCKGVTRQQITDRQCVVMSKNLKMVILIFINVRDFLKFYLKKKSILLLF